MCLDELSNADIKAIRKARGFTKNETASRAQLAAIFLSSIGVEKAMGTLSPKEIACLHLLKEIEQQIVDITFFERVYGSAYDSFDTHHYVDYTFNQAYKETYQAVKKKLIRKGLLLAAESRSSSGATILERTEFHFPSAFVPYLPPLVQEKERSDEPGQAKTKEIWRKKIYEVFKKQSIKDSYRVYLQKGYLKIGEYPFSIEALKWWCQNIWASEIDISMVRQSLSMHPVQALLFILDSLEPGEWLSAAQMEEVFTVLSYKSGAPELALVCEKGWRWGELEKLSSQSGVFFRRINMEAYCQPAVEDPGAFFEVSSKGGAVIINLDTIPFEFLEALNQVARLGITGQQLIARPTQTNLGQVFPYIRGHLLIDWLTARIPGFAQVFEAAREQWGKTILHENLLIARVKDLSLRVQIEQKLGDNVMLLSEDTIAFPHDSLTAVTQVLQKGGFVIKTKTPQLP
jgi:hypothetical protein